MRRSQAAWRMGAMLILSQACAVVKGLPLEPQDDALRVRSNPDAKVFTEEQSGESGFYNTELENHAHPTDQPFPTNITYLVFHENSGATHPSVPHLDVPDEGENQASALGTCEYRPGKPCPGVPHVQLSNQTSASTSKPNPGTAASQSTMADQDIFAPISTEPVPGNIPSRDDHPVPKDHVNADGPISTNKFYANFFLGSQTNYTFTHPYSVAWGKGGGSSKSYGLTVSHVEADKRAFGEPQENIPGHPVKHYINPIGIQSMALSAVELGDTTALTVANPTAFSADVIIQPKSGSEQSITFPLTQGMAFVTGVYNNLQPAIQSGVFFRDVKPADSPRDGVFKYKVTLEDDTTWLMYVVPDNGADPKMNFADSMIRGPTGFKGTIQVAKNRASDAGEKVFDKSSGAYAKSASVSGSVSGTQGTYSLKWEKAGKNVDSVPLLMFALPHHVESFDDETKGRGTDVKLITTTKGNATAYTGESWTMVEPNLPVDMDFAPYKPGEASAADLSDAAKEMIKGVAPDELAQNTDDQTNLDSMYFSGKGLNKFAGMVYAVQELLQDGSLASATMESLKKSFDRFIQNKQKWPLAYDSVWKGVVSTGTYETGDPGLDFGNTLYNDHHFHYGYFVLAAAYIGRLDPSWLDANKAYINTLLRDASNSVADDLFPFSRGFDWYHGHSWAKGLFESLDGKDEESTSEDTMFAYAVKMWGKTIGDASMEARGNMMLAILARSLNNYFLMKSDNVNQPSNFIANKVTGILFENKADHATYFGSNLEYIQGIHMLPLLPNSIYTRSPDFVKEEWEAMFAPDAAVPASTVKGGWQGVLYSNLAIIDAAKSWDFFAKQDFDLGSIDGGTSRIWCLAYAAGLGGGPK